MMKKHGITKEALTWNFLKDNAGYDGDECLIWPFWKNKTTGYGHIRVGRKAYVASRVMCALKHGEPINENLEAAHSCGNGHMACVNPNHLSWKTKVENARDRKPLEKGHCRKKLNRSIATSIRELLASAAPPNRRALAAQYDVTVKAINDIVNRRSYK